MFVINEMSLLAFNFGTQEMLIVMGVAVLLFGGARLPSLMRNMGRSINEFKAGMKDKPNTRVEEEESEADSRLEESEAKKPEKVS